MVDENEILTRLTEDLKAAGIEPEKYLGPQEPEPSFDELSAAYQQRMTDLYSTYAKRFGDLKEAFENSSEQLKEWQKTQAQVAQRIEQLPSKQ